MTDFVGFPKVPRLSRQIIITEKIDGTNAQICIEPIEPSFDKDLGVEVVTHGYDYITSPNYPNLKLRCGSRTRWITPKDDNHGFAKWAYVNANELFKLGVGRHFGEWWGQGINRGYGLKEKRFSLFNIKRWADSTIRPACCDVVPILSVCEDFNLREIEYALYQLEHLGSVAASGFMQPEGVVVYHTAGNVLFKKTLKDDAQGKEA